MTLCRSAGRLRAEPNNCAEPQIDNVHSVPAANDPIKCEQSPHHWSLRIRVCADTHGFPVWDDRIGQSFSSQPVSLTSHRALGIGLHRHSQTIDNQQTSPAMSRPIGGRVCGPSQEEQPTTKNTAMTYHAHFQQISHSHRTQYNNYSYVHTITSPSSPPTAINQPSAHAYPSQVHGHITEANSKLAYHVTNSATNSRQPLQNTRWHGQKAQESKHATVAIPTHSEHHYPVQHYGHTMNIQPPPLQSAAHTRHLYYGHSNTHADMRAISMFRSRTNRTT